jgi:hypothetical protein
MSRNGEKRENRQAFQQERHGSTKAPEVAASVVEEGEVSATLEDLGLFLLRSAKLTGADGDPPRRRELTWQ